MSSVRGQLRIKNRLLAKKEKQDKDRTTRSVSRKEQQDQCKACLKDTNLHHPIQEDILVCCVNTFESKIQFIPMIDRKLQDVQNGPRDSKPCQRYYRRY